jgi:hypothetical protein
MVLAVALCVPWKTVLLVASACTAVLFAVFAGYRERRRRRSATCFCMGKPMAPQLGDIAGTAGLSLLAAVYTVMAAQGVAGSTVLPLAGLLVPIAAWLVGITSTRRRMAQIS